MECIILHIVSLDVQMLDLLLRRMEICVAESEKRSGKNAMGMQETFTVYLIETR